MNIFLELLVIIFSENNKFVKYLFLLCIIWDKGINGEINFIIVMICF